jgi:hypothetical protein
MKAMAHDTTDDEFDIHVHGDIPLREGVVFAQVEEALKPLWVYAGAKNLSRGAASAFDDEPGIRIDAQTQILQICWTTHGDPAFRHVVEEACSALNELSREGAALEVSLYDVAFDEEEAGEDEESRDDYYVVFVGPTPAAILDVQRDLLVRDMLHVASRHFEEMECGPIIQAIDQMFEGRFNSMVGAMDIQKILRGQGGSSGPGPGSSPGGHGGGRKPRHLH